MQGPADLRTAWNEVAQGYLDYWAPRFRPWMEVAVAAMPPRLQGPIVVPCCGPGLELDLLAERFDRARLSGVDFSQSMVDLCAERGHTVQLGDAGTLAAGSNVLSTFGLQQLPEPGVALQRWVTGLPPGGFLSVMYWPYNTADLGPFDALRHWAETRLGRTPPGWEAGLLDGLGAEVHDVRFSIRHDSGRAFWKALLSSGPGRALVGRVPQPMLDEAETLLAQKWPGPFEHRPTARHVICRN